MKTYISIFDANKVKEAVTFREEALQLKIENLVANDRKISKLIETAVDNKTDVLQANYVEARGKEHLELFNFALHIALQIPEAKRNEFIKKHFPETYGKIVSVLDDVSNTPLTPRG